MILEDASQKVTESINSSHTEHKQIDIEEVLLKISIS